jgi:hypothetical protein
MFDAGGLAHDDGDLDVVHVPRVGGPPASLAGMQTIDLPREPVKQHMHVGLITVSADASVASAAAMLVEQGGKVVGVLSIEDLLLAVRSLRIESTIADHGPRLRALPRAACVRSQDTAPWSRARLSSLPARLASART